MQASQGVSVRYSNEATIGNPAIWADRVRENEREREREASEGASREHHDKPETEMNIILT